MSLPAHFVITGSSGSLGQLVVAALLARPETRGVVGVDLRAPAAPPADRRFRFHRGDVVDGLDELAGLRDVPAGAGWLHLAYPLDPRAAVAAVLRVATAGTEAFLRAAARAGAGKLVMASSAMIYGVRAEEERLTEDSALASTELAYAEGKRRLEAMARLWQAGGAELVILRPCTVLGPSVGRHALMDDVFTAEGALGVPDPRLQFLHEDDFVDAVLRVLAPGVRGVFNLGPSDDGVRAGELARLLGLAPPAIDRDELWRRAAEAWERGQPEAIPPAALSYFLFEWVVASEKAQHQLGWSPAWSSLDTYWCYLRAQRRRQRRDERKAVGS